MLKTAGVGKWPSTEFALHRLIAWFQFGHELHELGAGANASQVRIAGEQWIVRHARFRSLAQPAHSVTALTLESEDRRECVEGFLRIAELLHFVDIRWDGVLRLLKSPLKRGQQSQICR